MHVLVEVDAQLRRWSDDAKPNRRNVARLKLETDLLWRRDRLFRSS